MTQFDRFAALLPEILRHEGGYVDHPKDPGGATNLAPASGSAAWLGSYGALTAYDYINGARRPESINPATGLAVTGQRVAGAFAPG